MEVLGIFCLLISLPTMPSCFSYAVLHCIAPALPGGARGKACEWGCSDLLFGFSNMYSYQIAQLGKVRTLTLPSNKNNFTPRNTLLYLTASHCALASLNAAFSSAFSKNIILLKKNKNKKNPKISQNSPCYPSHFLIISVCIATSKFTYSTSAEARL